MIYKTDSLADQKFARKNAIMLAQDIEKEEKYISLRKFGIPCDGCDELFMYDQLEKVEIDDVGTAHLCKDC